MLLSAWTDKMVSFPLDAKKYERLLKKKIADSAKQKKQKRKVVTTSDDFTKSFGR